MPPVVSIVGRSDSGKTTIIEKLIPELNKMGFRVGTIKHHGHDFKMDYPGKDSWRHKEAGAAAVIISSPRRIGMVMDVDHDYSRGELLPFFSGLHIVFAEGYKGEEGPKIEVFRPEVHDRPLCTDDGNLIALISDSDLDLGVPKFGTEEISRLARFLIHYFKLELSL
ncbi:MAG: molybdopterin-guanine dinucleotide biosynthesis protein B [Pseudomonadota bacterium]